MVIRTLRDYDNDNSSSASSAMPVPPQWQSSGGRTTSGGSSGRIGTFADLNEEEQYGNQPGTGPTSLFQQPSSSSPDQQTDGMFWSWNLQEQPKWYHMVLLCCCPCFVGPPCSDVRKEDYKRMLKCFLFWVTILDIIYFIVELSVGGVTSGGANPSLGPPEKTLLLLGAKYGPKIKNQYQIWRLVTPIIMHAGFIHIFMNLFVQFMIGLAYERRWGAWRTATIYILSGIAGNLLSCCAYPFVISVGASGAIIGLIGARVGDIICRWSKMPQQARISNGVNIGITLLFVLLMSFTSKNVDWTSHLGGLVVGFFLSFAVFCNEIEQKSIRYVSLIAGIGLSFLFYLATILIFALAVNTN